VYVGLSFAGFNIVGYPYPEPGCYGEWSINSFQAVQTTGYTQGITGYQWGYRIVGIPGDVISPYNSQYYTFIPEQSGTYEIFVRAVDDCGIGLVESTKTVTVSGGCRVSGYTLSAFPNPAKDIIHLKVKENPGNTKQQTKASKILVELYQGSFSNKVRIWTFNTRQNQYDLNLGGLKKGIYFLLYAEGESKQTIQVVVE
jgi:hypothetical protein